MWLLLPIYFLLSTDLCAREENIEVIGRRIKKIDLESSTPITTIDRQQIEASGENTLGGLFLNLTEIDGVASENVTEPNSSRNVIRGLRNAPVLVLLNGKRFVNAPGSLMGTPGTDINVIPIGAVEKVEVLKDSVSALYGAGAVGGVINIITRSENTADDISFQYSRPTEKGGLQANISGSKNFSGPKYKVNTTFSYNHNQMLFSGDRDYLSPDISVFTDYPTRFEYDARETPVPRYHELCGKEGYGYLNETTGYCEMDVAPLYNKIPKVQQYSGLIDVRYKLKKQRTLFSTLLFSQKRVRSILGSSPGIIYTEDYEGNKIPDFIFRYFEAGERNSFQKTLLYDLNVGLEGYSSKNWDWNSHVSISSFNHRFKGKNFLHARETLNLFVCKDGPDYALEEGDCDSGNSFDPFAPKSERGDLSSALRDPDYRERSRLLSFESNMEGDFTVGSLPIDIESGFRLAREFYFVDAPEEDYLLTPKFDDANVHRETASLFGGIGTSLLNSKLRLDLNLRSDWYKDFGAALTPRFAFSTYLSPHLLVRGSVGRSFEAPSLLYRYGPSAYFFADVVDTLACKEAKQQQQTGDKRANANVATYCSAQSISTTIVSNKNLESETAETGNLGLVFNPNNRFHFKTDLWYMARNNYIGPVLSDATKLEYQEGSKYLEDHYGIVFERRFNGISGITDIVSIDTTVINLTKNEVFGLDFASSYDFIFLNEEFRISNKITYLFYNKIQPFSLLKAEDRVGDYNHPRWKHNLRFSWKGDRLTTSLFVRSIAGQKQENKTAGKLSSYSELDISMQFAFSKNSITHFGGKNILFTTPPLQNSPHNRFNSNLYSQRGTRFFIGHKYLF